MKPSKLLNTVSVALATAALGILSTLPAFAQDGAAPPSDAAPAPGATQAPPAAPPPSGDATPSEAAPVPATSAETTPEASPAQPSPSLVFLESEKKAAEARTAAKSDDDVLEPDDGTLGYHQDHFLAFAGLRVGKVTSPGYDPFADSDELAQFSAGLGKTVMTAGNFSIVGLFLYDIGGGGGEARGAESDLWVHRLTLGAEGRYHFIRQLFVFARVAPGAIHSIAKLEDPSANVESRAAREWVFATDLSAGAMFELAGFSRSRSRRPSAWFSLDGGYGFAGESELLLSADGNQGPERPEPVDLGPLALSGPFLRAAVVVTY